MSTAEELKPNVKPSADSYDMLDPLKWAEELQPAGLDDHCRECGSIVANRSMHACPEIAKRKKAAS